MLRKHSIVIPAITLLAFILFLSWTKKTSNSKQGFNLHIEAAGDRMRPDTIQRSYLALGDSYTIGQSVPASDRFPVQVVSKLRASGYKMADPEIIATTGWTTEDLWSEVQNISPAVPYDFVSLLIGVNDQYQGQSVKEYRNGFEELLKKSIGLAGNRPSHVIVLSIPDYSATPFATNSDKGKIASEIRLFNSANKQIADFYKVRYLNITTESRKVTTDHQLIAHDGLHYSRKEYGIWASLLKQVMEYSMR